MSVIDSKVVNIDELKLEHFAKGDKFECDAVRIGPLLGAKDLGYSYDVVPPGKRSCPFHSHRGEEEMFFIVKGKGTLRYGDETRKIRAGDVICCPTGGPETAHQIVNDSDAELAYLSVSTMLPAEVCEYPDSKKIGAFGGGLRHMTRADHAPGLLDGRGLSAAKGRRDRADGHRAVVGYGGIGSRPGSACATCVGARSSSGGRTLRKYASSSRS